MKMQSRNVPTVIELVIGSEFSRPVTLRDALTRIGSHPSCELRLSDAYAPPHLVTVERKGSELWLHNRSGQVVQVGDDELPTDATRHWRPGETARLNAWVSLQLARVPGPCSLPAKGSRQRSQQTLEGGQAGPRATTNIGSTKANSGRDAGSFVLSGILLVIMAWLLLGGEGPGNSQEIESVARLVQAIHGDESGRREGNSLENEICLQIQDARIAELRGVPGRATRVYGQVRDTLLTLRRPDGSFPDPWFEEAFSFVRQRLGSR